MSDKLPLSDMIREAPGPMPNAAKPGPATPRLPKTLRRRFDAAEASETPAAPGRAPPALPWPAHGLRQALADPRQRIVRSASEPRNASPRKPESRRGAAQRRPASSDPDASPALRAPRLSGRLAALAETAKAYARSAQADNTQRAYAADWRQFASWLRRQGLPETPPDPEAVGLYLASQVERRGAELSVATLERRLSGIAWRYRQLGQPLEIRDRHIATVLAGIRRRHGRPPLQKAAIFADELLAMLATLDMDLRGLRDRAILAIGFAGGLRRSEIVGLDCGPARPRTAPAGSKSFPKARS